MESNSGKKKKCFPIRQRLKMLVILPSKLPLPPGIAMWHSSSQCRLREFFSGMLGNTSFLIKRDSRVHLAYHMTGFLSSCIWAGLNDFMWFLGILQPPCDHEGNITEYTEDGRVRGWKWLGAFEATYFSISFIILINPYWSSCYQLVFLLLAS